jgi:hypothetical protein
MEEITISKSYYEELLEVERRYLILVSNELPAMLCEEIPLIGVAQAQRVLQTLRGVDVQN